MKAIRGAGKRSRKAVSPIVATVILVLISVVAGVMLWLWVSGFTSAATAQQPALNERIKIEAVEVSSSGGTYTVTIYVRNVGSVTTTIDYAYILKPDGTIIEEAGNVNVRLSPGEAKSVQVSNVSGTTSGYSYTVKVVTKNGVEASYTFVWP